MLPAQLTADHFNGYPPRARQIAAEHLALLRSLPLPFLALLLEQLIGYDWRFPAERRELDAQFSYLGRLSSAQLGPAMAPFANLRLTANLENLPWAASPQPFVESLTAHLWATHQIDSFRTAATEYMERARAAEAKDEIPAGRLSIVVIGREAKASGYPLFRRLRPHGTYFGRLDAANGWAAIYNAVAARAAKHPLPYGHWYIDGGAAESRVPSPVVTVSWNALAPLRNTLLERIRQAKLKGDGSEAVRSMLARLDADEVEHAPGGDAVLRRFEVSLLTEGSGTQLYSTTFVQWACREALRRAQPATLLARYAPRERELSLGEVLSNPHQERGTDPEGSLIDADMGAYYTWLSQQRLSRPEDARFLVWFEGQSQALAIAPKLQAGTECTDRIGLSEVLRRMS
jgi:hypothetical protein